MLEIFEDEKIICAMLHEGPILRTTVPTLTVITLLEHTVAAEHCRYMDIVMCDHGGLKNGNTRRKWRIILRERTEEAIIKELEYIGLVEVPKGTEDPEDLKRVWVR